MFFERLSLKWWILGGFYREKSWNITIFYRETSLVWHMDHHPGRVIQGPQHQRFHTSPPRHVRKIPAGDFQSWSRVVADYGALPEWSNMRKGGDQNHQDLVSRAVNHMINNYDYPTLLDGHQPIVGWIYRLLLVGMYPLVDNHAHGNVGSHDCGGDCLRLSRLAVTLPSC